MGFFDKKYCDVCGAKIGLLGNRKLEDGNLCKDCAKKLSPWFDDRRNSTVEEIKAQLEYRELNKEVLREFNPTRTFGKNTTKVYIDEPKGQFVVARDLRNGDNHDVINISQVTSCYMDVQEYREEKFQTDSEGNRKSYNPPRFDYDYDYKLFFNVNAPYFDEIELRLVNFRVDQHDHINRHEAESLGRQIVAYFNQATGNVTNMSGMSAGNMQMRNGRNMTAGDNFAAAAGMFFDQVMQNAQQNQQPQYQQAQYQQPQYQQPQYQQPRQTASAPTQWVCSGCGATNSGRFCEWCGTPRG